MNRLYFHWVAIFLAMLALFVLAFQKVPENGFHFDDAYSIVRDESIHIKELSLASITHLLEKAFISTRPLANVSFAVDWLRGEGEAAPFLWTNLILHALATTTVFLLLLMLMGKKKTNPGPPTLWAAGFGAAVWALHPIQLQSVTYSVQRMTSMAAWFTLAAILLFIQGQAGNPGWRRMAWLGGATLCFVLGVLSKENALILPVLLTLVHFTHHRSHGPLVRVPWEWGLLLWPLIGLLLAVVDIVLNLSPLAAYIHGTYQTQDFTLGERLLTQPRVLFFHLSQILWPDPGRFSLEWDFATSTGWFQPWTTALALLGVLTWCGVGGWLLWRPGLRLMALFVLWPPATLFIESSFVGLEMIFEHRFYLPLFGLAGLTALGVRRILSMPGNTLRIGMLLLLLVPLTLALLTRQRVPVWRDSFTRSLDNIQHAPRSARLHANLGKDFLLMHHDRVNAEKHLTQAMALDPSNPAPLTPLAVLRIEQGRLAEAEQLLYRFTTLRKRVTRDYLNTFGELRLAQKRYQEAAHHFQEAIHEAPGFPTYRWNLALALEGLGQCHAAEKQWRTYLTLEKRPEERRPVLEQLQEVYQTPGGTCYHP